MATEKVRSDLRWQNAQRLVYFIFTLGFIAAGTGGQHLDDVIKTVAGVFQ